MKRLFIITILIPDKLYVETFKGLLNLLFSGETKIFHSSEEVKVSWIFTEDPRPIKELVKKLQESLVLADKPETGFVFTESKMFYGGILFKTQEEVDDFIKIYKEFREQNTIDNVVGKIEKELGE